MLTEYLVSGEDYMFKCARPHIPTVDTATYRMERYAVNKTAKFYRVFLPTDYLATLEKVGLEIHDTKNVPRTVKKIYTSAESLNGKAENWAWVDFRFGDSERAKRYNSDPKLFSLRFDFRDNKNPPQLDAPVFFESGFKRIDGVRYRHHGRYQMVEFPIPADRDIHEYRVSFSKSLLNQISSIGIEVHDKNNVPRTAGNLYSKGHELESSGNSYSFRFKTSGHPRIKKYNPDASRLSLRVDWTDASIKQAVKGFMVEFN